MGTSIFSILVSVQFSYLLFLVSFGSSTSIDHGNFLHCLSLHSNTSIPTYTPNSYNYSSILESTIFNLRFASSTTPKPRLIVTPLHESHVQAAVICSRKHGIQIKVRSGGHDLEGISYVSDVPFIIIDLFNLRSISIEVENRTAWVQSGATTGEIYYRIAEKSSTLAFPAAFCHTVGVGGHLSGGGYGTLLRKYGLAADNVIDARLVDVNGNILDKEAMGEDLFWAIRGGGSGGSFGVIVSWKIRLVPIPPSVTAFSITRTLEQGLTALIQKWQEVAHKLPQELFLPVFFQAVNTTTGNREKTIQALFLGVFLGGAENLTSLMKERFPELGLESKDFIEMSWIQTVLVNQGLPMNTSLDVLLNITQPKTFFKIKSDYVKEPISQIGLEGLWSRLIEDKQARVYFMPYGGKMSEISESEIPFPHRDGNLFMIGYDVIWPEQGSEASEVHISWTRRVYKYLTPYVSKLPRAAYANYRDLDLGQNKNGTTTYLQGKAWGSRYFKRNYERLVHVKSKVDPDNFFRNEQSIPTIAY